MASKVKTKPKSNWNRFFSGLTKEPPTLANQSSSKLTTGFWLFVAFFVPFILMFISFALAKVHPFGDNQILATDLWHQYYPFLEDYHDKLQNGGSLLWTWKTGGGTNYPALLAYYAASPLNLLSVFFPAEALRDFVYYATCVKIGLAGMFFALFLRITFKKRDASIAAFGIMYALCAFIMGYYWNIIWLDTIALVPLVVAGTIALLREGKFRLYIITLALSIITNYYISLFTCIFVALVSIGYTIVEFKGWRKTLRDFFKMAGCTIVSFLISAALILPVYFALKSTHSSDNTFPEAFSTNMGTAANFGGVLAGMGKTIGNSVAFIQPTPKEGLPNVYCGVFTIFLAILFLFCSKIKLRERLFCVGLLVFFMLSFVIRQLDYIWHGFHFPNMLPYRFSFLFSFVVIYMAFRVFSNIDSVKPIAVLAGICGFLIYLGIAHRYYTEGGTSPSVTTLSSLFTSADPESNPDPVFLSGFFGMLMAAWVLLYSFRGLLSRMMQACLSAVIGVASLIFIVIHAGFYSAIFGKNENASAANGAESASGGNIGFIVAVIVVMLFVIVAVFFALYSKQYNQNHRALRAMLSVILVTLALVEGTYSAAIGVKTVHVTERKWYPLGTDDTLAMVDRIEELEKDTVDIYRSELTRYYTLNDPTLIGVNGISMFSSMANRDITDYMEKFGVCGWIACNRYTYQESSPFTNMMLNIKYLISPNSNPDNAYRDKTNLTKVENQNFVTLLKNNYYLPMGFMVNEDLLKYDVSSLSSTDPISNQNLFFRLATGLSGDLYELIPTTSSSTSVTATAPSAGIAVAYCTPHEKSAYDVTISKSHVTVETDPQTGEKIDKTDTITEKANIQRPFIMMVGSVEAGDTLTVSAGSGSMSGYFAILNEDLFKKAYNQFKSSALDATYSSGDSLRGYIDVKKDGLFYTSIPAINGWEAYVDGEKVDITPVGKALTLFIDGKEVESQHTGDILTAYIDQKDLKVEYSDDEMTVYVDGKEIESRYVGGMLTASVDDKELKFLSSGNDLTAFVNGKKIDSLFDGETLTAVISKELKIDHSGDSMTLYVDGKKIDSEYDGEILTAVVDGEDIEAKRIGGAMLAFKLDKGEHFIELKYIPTGLIPGLILTGFGILLFIAMLLLSWKKINLIDRVLVRAGVPAGASKGIDDAASDSTDAGTGESPKADKPAKGKNRLKQKIGGKTPEPAEMKKAGIKKKSGKTANAPAPAGNDATGAESISEAAPTADDIPSSSPDEETT